MTTLSPPQAVTVGTAYVDLLRTMLATGMLHLETNEAVKNHKGLGTTSLVLSTAGTAKVPVYVCRVVRSGVGKNGAALDAAYGLAATHAMLPVVRRKLREVAEAANRTGGFVVVAAGSGGGTGLAGYTPVLNILRELVDSGKLIVLHSPWYKEGAKTAMRLLDRIEERPRSRGEFHVIAPSPEMSAELLALPPEVFAEVMGVAVNLEQEDTATVGARLGLHQVRVAEFEPLALAGEAAREAYQAAINRWAIGWSPDPAAAAARLADVARRAADRATAKVSVPEGMVQQALDAGPGGEAVVVSWAGQAVGGHEVLGMVNRALGELARAGLTAGMGAVQPHLDRVHAHLDALEARLGTTTLPDLIRTHDEAGWLDFKGRRKAAQAVRDYAAAVVQHRLGRALSAAFDTVAQFVEERPVAVHEHVLLDGMNGLGLTLVRAQAEAILAQPDPFSEVAESDAQRAAERAALASTESLVLAAVAREVRPNGALAFPWALEEHVSASAAHGVVVSGPVSAETAESVRHLLGAERFQYHYHEDGPVRVIRLGEIDKLSDSGAFAKFVANAETEAETTPDKRSRTAGDVFPVRIRPDRAREEEAVMALLLAALTPGCLVSQDGEATVAWPGGARVRLDSLEAVRDGLPLDVEVRLHRRYWNERFASDPLLAERHLERISKASGAKATADNERWERLASVCGIKNLETARVLLAERQRVVRGYLRGDR